MGGWIYSTLLPSARPPKIQGVLFVVDSGESGGSLALGRDGRGELGGGRGGRSRVVVGRGFGNAA